MTKQTEDQVVTLYNAGSVIERDSLIEALAENGVEAHTVDRDMRRQVSSGVADLTLGGYSAVTGGFPIYINRERRVEAEKILQEFLKDKKIKNFESRPENYMARFERCAVFTFFVPGLFHILGLIYFIQAIKRKEKMRGFKFIFSALFFLFTAVGYGYFAILAIIKGT